MTKTVAIINDKYDSQVSDTFFDVGYNIINIDDRQIKSVPIDVRDVLYLKSQLDRLKNVHAIVFCGGTDINSYLYGEEPYAINDTPDCVRDLFEILIFKEGRRRDIPLIGICRGAQLLNVLSGGSLYQHDTHHLGHHDLAILDAKGSYIKNMYAPANHHQIMNPSDQGKILARNLLTTEMLDDDCEVVYYKHSRSLCHQPHPEWVTDPTSSLYFDWFFEHVDTLLKGEHL